MTMPVGPGMAPSPAAFVPSGAPPPGPPAAPFPAGPAPFPSVAPRVPSASVAPAVPQPAQPPPQAPPATLAPDAKLTQRQPADKIQNPFERQASMIVETAGDWATRLAANLGEHPSNTTPATPDTVHEMFHFSPYGMAAPEQFWRTHDELLQMAMQNNDPDPYAVAERGALREVYPYREKIALLDTLNPDAKVQRAEQLLAMSHREMAKGNTHDSLPSLVGPAALPPPSNGGR